MHQTPICNAMFSVRDTRLDHASRGLRAGTTVGQDHRRIRAVPWLRRQPTRMEACEVTAVRMEWRVNRPIHRNLRQSICRCC
jgi:hypothetical protein